MIAKLAVAKRVILLKRMVDTLPLLPVVAAAPRLHRSGSHDPGDEKQGGALPDRFAGSAPISEQIHAPQTANTSFCTIPRASISPKFGQTDGRTFT
jgi:hypothetical protein